MHYPKITLVTPSYNQGQFLEKTILSVLDQGYPNLEYIIMDGGSTDNSVEIIRRYANKLSHWESTRDRGQSHAINKGFKLASGEILSWLNSDDILLPDALNKVSSAFNQAPPDVGAIVGLGKIVNDAGEVVRQPRPYPVTHAELLKWLDGRDFMQPSCFFRKSAFDEVGPLDEQLFYSMDLDLWLKIARKYSFGQLHEPLSVALAHKDAKTTANTKRMRMETILLLERHGEHQAALLEGNRFADEFFRHYEEYKIVRKSIAFRCLVRPFLRARLKSVQKTLNHHHK